MEQMWEFIQPVQSVKPRFETDHQKVFDDKNIDAVIIATQDNWHAPLTIMACQAGKDVYVEKPHFFCMWESDQMVAAAAKHNRIVQVGTQNRSTEYNLHAREIVQSGKLGKIGLVKVFNLKSGGPFRMPKEAGTPPPGFDWDRWLGRAAMRPYHQRLWRGGWHWNWDFCGGDLTDDSIHQVDLALMVMGDPGLPVSVRALGGRYVHKGDDAEVPDVLNIAWDYKDFVMTFDMSQYPKYMEKSTDALYKKRNIVPDWTQNATRIEIYGQEMLMILGRHGGGFVVEKGSSQIVDKVYGTPGDKVHYINFIECIKSRKQPTADVAIAHASNLVAHMGNIAHRVGNVAMNYDPVSGKFDNQDANAMIKASYRKGYELPVV